MIRRHVLAALTAGIEAGDEDVARTSLAAIDWVLRFPARRRLEAALLDATIAVGAAAGDDVRAVRHRLRAAVLIVANAPPCELADRDAVTAAYADVAVPAPPRLPIVTGLAAVATMACAMVLVFAMVRVVTVGAANGEFRRPSPPPVAGAFRTGGAPLHNSAIERVLAVELPALDAHRVTDEPGRKSRVASLRDHRAFSNHGSDLAAAWRNLVDTFAHWQELGSSVHSTHRRAAIASRELRARVLVMSDQLAAVGLGYVLDVEVGDDPRQRAGIYAFRVDEVGFVRAGTARQRVLGVRRLDHLTDEVTILGMTAGERQESRDPIVLLDEVDDKVRTQILPVLGGQPYLVGDDSWARTTQGRRVALAASEAIRRELHTALGFDVGSLERATARCRKLVTSSVRHHEAQHGFDRDRDLPYPPGLAHAGPASSPLALRTRYELSGYLSELASDIWLPQLTLWNLSRHAFRRTPKRVEEAYVAVYVIEGLARQLGIPSPGPVIHHGAIDRDRLAALAIPLAERSTTELRSAAAALWAASFGTRLVRITDD
ncbi:MAG: hypothetical protein H0T89_13285 [Deltaproteobacteria bacterium]|nr:hypothetical protein [Deltaproteobacteria bacterium]MDQ3300715.1 hypothetical protein [Myxococcota bacterium]